MKKILIVLILLRAFVATAQHFPSVTIPGSEVRKITSAIVDGQEYELHILLPAGYDTSTRKYPVVYLMDSQWDFPVVKSIYGQQYFDGFIPELIIVGVTWGGTHPNPDSLRARDYTPTAEARLPQSGGADKFLDFMRNELFPFVETNYKAEAGNRTLMGCSLGGLFTLYTLFTHTDMFTGYAAASPAVGWDKEVMYQFEKSFAQKKLAGPVHVYLTVGDVEMARPVFEKFAANMKQHNYQNVFIRSKVLENTGHSGTKSETYSRGLQYIFERKNLKPGDQLLSDYAGIYQSATGEKVTIKKLNGRLQVYISPQTQIMLYANTKEDFYATHQFFNMHFKSAGARVEGFDLMLYGGKQTFSKVR